MRGRTKLMTVHRLLREARSDADRAKQDIWLV